MFDGIMKAVPSRDRLFFIRLTGALPGPLLYGED